MFDDELDADHNSNNRTENKRKNESISMPE